MAVRSRTHVLSPDDCEVTALRTGLVVALVLIGLACIAVAIVYFIEPAKHLPSFLPGHASHGHLHGYRHGVVALGVGLIALLGAVVARQRYRAGFHP
jgi:hypothetical protein